jgi:hypothetical protein
MMLAGFAPRPQGRRPIPHAAADAQVWRLINPPLAPPAHQRLRTQPDERRSRPRVKKFFQISLLGHDGLLPINRPLPKLTNIPGPYPKTCIPSLADFFFFFERSAATRLASPKLQTARPLRRTNFPQPFLSDGNLLPASLTIPVPVRRSDHDPGSRYVHRQHRTRRTLDKATDHLGRGVGRSANAETFQTNATPHPLERPSPQRAGGWNGAPRLPGYPLAGCSQRHRLLRSLNERGDIFLQKHGGLLWMEPRAA